MNASVPEWFLNTGILQFGYFVTANEVTPVRFCPEYLPAYPQLLAEMAKLALSQLNIVEFDHLIATNDSLPLGLVCSLKTDLSLVYSRGQGEGAVYDLVGSYNSGHVSALLLNCINNKASIEQFIANARSVGLETHMIIPLLEIAEVDQLAGISVRPVFRLTDIVQQLVMIERLSEGQARAVRTWISEQQL